MSTRCGQEGLALPPPTKATTAEISGARPFSIFQRPHALFFCCQLPANSRQVAPGDALLRGPINHTVAERH